MDWMEVYDWVMRCRMMNCIVGWCGVCGGSTRYAAVVLDVFLP